jgi:exonuclease V
VTDMVSPAWCELQYWYTLTRHGRKKRTPAMKQGSTVHKRLEDQVHTTVKVDIATKEDAWGLRIWNVIQGLRTLRDTGQTRELEIWGVVDGIVVNGIIDELSYICPDAALEDSLQKSSAPPQGVLDPDQPTILNYFFAAGARTLAEAAKVPRRSQNDKVYLCDVKTRSVRSLPSEAAFRPTKMQLMLYHRLLSSLAVNDVDFSILTTRYDLDPLGPFSDSFIAQVGSLNDDSFYETDSVPNGSQELEHWSQDSMATLLAHNSLSALWSFMISEFQNVLPLGTASLGNVLQAEYRKSDTGEVMGSKTFAMEEDVLKSYVGHEMQWWRGEREPQGVVIEEAFKCRTCEFADDCEWRLGKVEEATRKARKSRLR